MVTSLLLHPFPSLSFPPSLSLLSSSLPLHPSPSLLSLSVLFSSPSATFSDVQKIEDGIGEKFSIVIQFVTTFFAAFVVSFTQEWRLTLVMLAYTPIIIAVTIAFGKVCVTFNLADMPILVDCC